MLPRRRWLLQLPWRLLPRRSRLQLTRHLLPRQTRRQTLCFVAAVGPMVLSIGSDCSGWCTELQAARAVCPFPVRQVLACDNAAHVRRLVQHCIKPTCLFDDLRTRGFDQTQHLDIYVAGWPCQAFSKAGLMHGMADKGRGALIMEIIAFIEATLPTSFHPRKRANVGV